MPHDIEQRKEIQEMAKTMSEAIKSTLQERSKGKLITQDNVTLFDVYKQEKVNERLIRQMIELVKDSVGHQQNDIIFPFNMPLKTRRDVESCEEFIENDTNYQTLVDYVKNKLKRTNPEDYSKAFVKLMYADEVFNEVGWAAKNEKRLSAISLKTFGQFVSGK